MINQDSLRPLNFLEVVMITIWRSDWALSLAEWSRNFALDQLLQAPSTPIPMECMLNGSNRRTPPAPPSLASGQHLQSLAATKFYWRIRCSHPTMDSTPLTQLLATTNRNLETPFSSLEPTNMATLVGTLGPIRTKWEFSIQSVSFDQPL